MDFQSLTRRELQTLCKKNKIPANMTNVAMADALKALQNVDGLEELLNPSESQNPQSPEKPEIGSPEIPRTVCRTSTRRRPIKAAEEPESSQTLTRTHRGTRRIKEEVNQEKSEVRQTPAVPSSRKRAPAASARQKTVTRVEQSSVQRVYSTRRSARLSEKLPRTEPMEVEFSKVMTKDFDGDEEENKGADSQTISEDNSKITDDSEVISKSVLSGNDSKAEVEENTGDSAKPDNSDFLEVSEEKDEAHDEQENTEAELQKNSEVDCEKMEGSNKLLSEILKTSVHLNDESTVKKVIMSNTKNWNEGLKLENEQQHGESDLELDLTAPPQASVDDSSCDSETRELNLSNTKNLNEDSKLENEHRESDLELDLTAPLQASVDDSEKPELSMSAFADEVVCQNPVSMDSEMNVTSEGEPDDDDDGKVADQGDCEEFDMDLNKKAGDGSMDFEDVSPPSNGYDPMSMTGEPHSEVCVNVDETNNLVEPLPKGDEMSVVFHELNTAEENAMAVYKFPSLLDNFPTPVKITSPHRPASNTAVSGRTPLSPLAASPLLGQAPLPTLSTPTRKSSSKMPSATKMMTLLSDNKENLDNSGRKMVLKTQTEKKKNSRDTAEDIMLKKFSDTSLRQLRKMFKEKLQIKENTNKNNEDMNDVMEVAKMRPALQTLPENRMAEVETGKEN
ncbi:altered inheritance of mitochondria protein 21-like isoform X2 [Vitis riparia]|uniref:altered inheritance of mitochondria protein 21-like isoform X2 n=1 Tax=Vitis riparia TaxID=96939 RepID=UPI00155AC645|nr:altered inheritance of mitochondria protein 21-like isoform X2 [Vitis riparia]